jgi:transcriptional regulator with XRE-family HTH domain
VGILAAGIGPVLRTLRQLWRLSLREVEGRSLHIALEKGDMSYRVSASWLNRLEHNEHELTVNKLITLAEIYSIPTGELIRSAYSRTSPIQIPDQLFSSHLTISLTGIIQERQAKHFRLATAVSDHFPNETTLLPKENAPFLKGYRWGIIGKLDLSLDPMIQAGSIVRIDTRSCEISSQKDWIHEFQRPIYFLTTQKGHVCGWCELDKASEWLTLIPHPLSTASSRRWKFHEEIVRVARVVAVAIRF